MLSIVVPVFNEEEGLENFYKELIKYIPGIEKNYEVIFVDDGSLDDTLEILKKIALKNSLVKIFSLRKHKGKAEALTLGFSQASGDYILTIDADLQDKPDQIEKLIKKSKEDWDVVSGWRRDRKDSFVKVISSRIFNLLSSLFWGLRVKDLNCGLKLYKKEAAKSLNLYGGMHRFIPLLLHEQGFTIAEVPVAHGKRRFGKSKYSFTKVFTEMPDIFTMLFLSRYGRRPLHFFAPIGGIMFFAGIAILFYLTVLKIEGYAIGGRPLLFLGMILVISGLQVLFTGFLADLIISKTSKNNNKEFILKYKSK